MSGYVGAPVVQLVAGDAVSLEPPVGLGVVKLSVVSSALSLTYTEALSYAENLPIPSDTWDMKFEATGTDGDYNVDPFDNTKLVVGPDGGGILQIQGQVHINTTTLTTDPADLYAEIRYRGNPFSSAYFTPDYATHTMLYRTANISARLIGVVPGDYFTLRINNALGHHWTLTGLISPMRKVPSGIIFLRVSP